jgi:hypothetical protein
MYLIIPLMKHPFWEEKGGEKAQLAHHNTLQNDAQ